LSYTLKEDTTKELVVALSEKGWSSYEISKETGISPRNIQYFLAKGIHKEWWDKQVEGWTDKTNLLELAMKLKEGVDTVRRVNGLDKSNKPKLINPPKILFFDIETAPMAGAVWSLWQNNVGLNQIERDWYVLSWAAKWQHEDKVMYQDKSNTWDTEDDKDLLQDIWKLLDEADIVVGQNSKRFDEKKLNARFILNGMKPPSSYRSIDTLEIAKRHFGFTSNKLEYMTDKLCKRYKKLNHGKFAGYELWKQCLKGNPEAWLEMFEYNVNDVLSLEELYDILKPWYKSHPNLNVYHSGSEVICSCGNDDFTHSGYHYTNLSKFDKFKCTSCGAETRGSVNLLSPDKREFLRRNIL
jgi:uncharacterized protein YprB with RNaseH-like and TPR domain